MVCTPAAARRGSRIEGSVSEWQYASHGGITDSSPLAACVCAAASAWYPSLTWNVPVKAATGLTLPRTAGSRASTMLILSWAPSGSGPAGVSPSSADRVAGATLARMWPAATVYPDSPCRTVTAPSGSIAVTSAPVRISAPAARAARARAALTAPIPPTGTRQAPVPLPMRW